MPPSEPGPLKSNAWFRQPQIRYSMQLLAITLLAVSLMLSNPIRDHKHDVFNQTLVPSKIYVTRALDPLKFILRKGDLPPLLNVVDQAETDSDKTEIKEQTVLKYINKHVFQEDDDAAVTKKIYEVYGKARGSLSPLQMTMMLSGCYGPSNVTLSWLKNNEAWIADASSADSNKNWLIPLMLDYLENTMGSNSEMCTCMKDFAAPNILMVEADIEAKENTRYQYDTCLGQNLQDYTNAGVEVMPQTEESITIAFADSNKRYRADPLKTEAAAYFEAKIAEGANGKISTDVTLYSAVAVLCADSSSASLSCSTFSSKGGDTTFEELKASFTKNSVVYGFIHSIRAWNKARPPLLRDTRDSAAQPPQIKADDYKAYMNKYQHAFAVCRHSAAPAYTQAPVARVRVFDYLRLGQGLLLLGALVGFMYWRSTAECEDGQVQLLMFLKVAAFLLELLILVSVCISLAQMTSTQDEADEFNPFDFHQINDNSTISWVLALSWVFVVVLILVLTFLSVSSLRSGGCLPFAPAQVAMDVCIIAGLANMAVALVLQRGFGDENVVVGTYMLFVTIGLMQHISNIARICQQAATDKGSLGVHESQRFQIAWNRTANALFVVLLLLAFGFSANTTFSEWTTDMLYTHQHMWIFVFYAVAIFCGYDAYHELYANARGGCCDMFEVMLGRKMRVTAWILVIGAVLLHFHQYSWMCLTKEPFVDDDGSGWTACRPLGYLYGNTRFYEWE